MRRRKKNSGEQFKGRGWDVGSLVGDGGQGNAVPRLRRARGSLVAESWASEYEYVGSRGTYVFNELSVVVGQTSTCRSSSPTLNLNVMVVVSSSETARSSVGRRCRCPCDDRRRTAKPSTAALGDSASPALTDRSGTLLLLGISNGDGTGGVPACSGLKRATGDATCGARLPSVTGLAAMTRTAPGGVEGLADKTFDSLLDRRRWAGADLGRDWGDRATPGGEEVSLRELAWWARLCCRSRAERGLWLLLICCG